MFFTSLSRSPHWASASLFGEKATHPEPGTGDSTGGTLITLLQISTAVVQNPFDKIQIRIEFILLAHDLLIVIFLIQEIKEPSADFRIV